MDLTAEEARVLGCLLEAQVARPEVYAVTLDELRFSCNQTTGRDPVMMLDDKVVEDTLLALKSRGLARFVVAGRNSGPTSYRHRADERWRLGPLELAALSVLLLRGPQTVDQVYRLLDEAQQADSRTEVEAALDTLAGRTPRSLASRLPSVDGGAPRSPGDVVWVEVLTGAPPPVEPVVAFPPPVAAPVGEPLGPGRRGPDPGARGGGGPGPRHDSADGAGPGGGGGGAGRPAPTLADVVDRLGHIERRLAGIEAALVALRGGGQDRPAQDRSGQDRSGQDRSGQDRSGQDRSGQDRSGQDRSGPQPPPPPPPPQGQQPQQPRQGPPGHNRRRR